MKAMARLLVRNGQIGLGALILGCSLIASALSSKSSDQQFLWGVSTSAYQVEGAHQADGKGRSVWDVYTNDFHLTAPVIGNSDTGNVAANMYDRDQYLADITLMKRLGVNAYRFSISWSRILPGGTGPVNSAGLAHYSQLKVPVMRDRSPASSRSSIRVSWPT
jgi:Glycosyl hydrolase family 1